jgi:hypothetical protein
VEDHLPDRPQHRVRRAVAREGWRRVGRGSSRVHGVDESVLERGGEEGGEEDRAAVRGEAQEVTGGSRRRLQAHEESGPHSRGGGRCSVPQPGPAGRSRRARPPARLHVRRRRRPLRKSPDRPRNGSAKLTERGARRGIRRLAAHRARGTPTPAREGALLLGARPRCRRRGVLRHGPDGKTAGTDGPVGEGRGGARGRRQAGLCHHDRVLGDAEGVLCDACELGRHRRGG